MDKEIVQLSASLDQKETRLVEEIFTIDPREHSIIDNNIHRLGEELRRAGFEPIAEVLYYGWGRLNLLAGERASDEQA